MTLIVLFGFLTACGSEFSQVTAGRIGLNRDDLDFLQTQLGRTSNAQFQIENNGDGDLIVQNIEILNSSPYITFSSGFMTDMAIQYDWRQSDSGQSWDEYPEFALRALGAIQVDLNFTPADTDLTGCEDPSGQPCGQIVVTTNDRDTPVISLDIYLDQSAGLIAVDPTVVQFPDVTGGPFEDEFVIENQGSGPLEIIEVTDPGIPGVSLYEETNRQEPFLLETGENSTYVIEFTPDPDVDYEDIYCGGSFDPATGCTLGEILVESDDALGNLITITVQIGGVSVPDIELSVDELEFIAAIGETATQTVDVSNVGGAPLNWNLRIDDPQVRDLFTMDVGGIDVSVGGQQMSSLVSGNTETISITLTPVDDAVVRGELVITATNDPDEGVNYVQLYGGEPVPELEVEPTQLNFPDITVGTSTSMSMVLLNNGRSDLDVSAVTLSGSDEFTIDPDPTGESIAPGSHWPITVTYTRPEDDLSGLDHGIMVILSNALAPNNEYSYSFFANHVADALPPEAVIEEMSPPDDGVYQVGDTVTLSGASSAPPLSGDLVSNPYNWVFLNKPDGSSTTLSSDWEETVSLIPDMPGSYTVMLTVTASISAGVSTNNQATRNIEVVE
jgi:hypothetical protein